MTGEPIHVELGVQDADAARAFYGALLGWSASGSSGNGQVSTPTLNIGIHDGDPASHFEVFFEVDDLDAALAEVQRLGGAVNSEVHHSEGFGRWAECNDDQGVHFGLRQADA